MSVIQQEQIDSLGAKVEILWAKPEGAGPWPLLLFIHGHMEPRIGAHIHSNFLTSQKLLNRWRVCMASVSQPGYGTSEGPADYCGPKTQEAITDTIEFFRQRSFVDNQRICVIGYSRGAICAANIAAREKSLEAEQLALRAPNAQLKMYSEYGHHIPFRVFFREVRKFLQKTIGEQ